MNHWLMLPILIPSFAAIILLLGARVRLPFQRAFSLVAVMALAAASGYLVWQAATGQHFLYELGSWPAPFGIVLVLDRLSALMVLLTSTIALPAAMYASLGWDKRGKNFHALFQFQLMGINGAFLTGDIFNLFVFFEILLIASYGLMLHGGGRERVGAGLHYVVFNLAGSAFFIIALGIIYGSLGTLNMADLSLRVLQVSADGQAVVRAGALLLLVVFAVKAALLPLYFWLPRTYGEASAPVAALFAIMTKVGVYGILRVYTLVFPNHAPVMSDILPKVLLPLALLTLVLAVVGALGARSLRRLVGYLVIASVGTLLAGVALFSPASLSASIFYMIHSTLIIAALFLLAELISKQRGAVEDRLTSGPAVAQPVTLGTMFFVAAVGVAGLPPLGGFLGKLFILESSLHSVWMPWLFGIILPCGLLGLIALSRAGSTLFWKTAEGQESSPASKVCFLPITLLLAAVAGLTVAAGPIHAYSEAVATQLLHPNDYIEAVLGPQNGSETSVRGEGQPSTPLATGAPAHCDGSGGC